MKNLREYLEEQINENLIQAVLSAGRNKDGISKIKIRPIRLKGQICYQASATEGQKVLHKNYGRTELIEYVEKELAENFRQFQAQGAVTDGVVLVSKKGKMTIKQKHHEQKENAKPGGHSVPPAGFLIFIGCKPEGKLDNEHSDGHAQRKIPRTTGITERHKFLHGFFTRFFHGECPPFSDLSFPGFLPIAKKRQKKLPPLQKSKARITLQSQTRPA